MACAAGSYSFENPYKVSHCNQCPSKIECFGGNQIGPKSGYWMESSHSLNALKCPYPSACLFEIFIWRFSNEIFRGGYVEHEYFSNGKCQFPHQGNLCNQCAPKFAKFGSKVKSFRVYLICFTGSAKCEDCRNTMEYYSKFALFLLLQVAIILGLFKLNEKQHANNTFYVNIMKILISFIQINSIIASYNLNWSPLVNLLFWFGDNFFPRQKISLMWSIALFQLIMMGFRSIALFHSVFVNLDK